MACDTAADAPAGRALSEEPKEDSDVENAHDVVAVFDGDDDLHEREDLEHQAFYDGGERGYVDYPAEEGEVGPWCSHDRQALAAQQNNTLSIIILPTVDSGGNVVVTGSPQATSVGLWPAQRHTADFWLQQPQSPLLPES